MGGAGVLEKIRNFGYKSFSPWIDESYDNEPNLHKRLNMIYSEIQRLCAMSIEELHKWYWSMEDILVHNRNKLMTLYMTDNVSQAFIDYMHGRVRNP